MVQETPNLKGRVVAVTRPAGQTEEAGELIREMGGIPYFIPAIEIKGLSNLEPIKKFTTELSKGGVDYVILMSTNGVKYLFEASEELKLTSQLKAGLAKTFMIAVGPRTAEELKNQGIHANLIPAVYTSEGIVESMRHCNINGKTIVIPRTSASNPILKEKLTEMGATVKEVYVYDSTLPSDSGLKRKFFDELKSQRVDAVVFGSGLCAKNLFEMLKDFVEPKNLAELLNGKSTIVAIGPVTEAALTQLGVESKVTPCKHTFEDALKALAQYWQTETVNP